MPPLTPLTFQILLSLSEGPLHGYGILAAIDRRSLGRETPSTGALYLALQRLEGEGMVIDSASPPDEADPRRRYRALTPAGREALALEAGRMARLVGQAVRKGVLPGREAREAMGDG